MKRWRLLVGLLWALMTMGASLALPGSATVASAPPSAAVPDLTEFRGKLVYVDFWASWCVPCRQSFPWMNSMYHQYAKDGFVVLAVNMDQIRADADSFLKQYPADFPVRFDAQGQLAQQFKVRGMPTSALIGRDGKLLWTHEGFRSKDPAALEQAIRAALH